ncbi:MAG: hypothetical protein FJZ61_06245 [Chlamydiae bacterium]|nr:hypothetical protein [Chlamydiota bacterium]
MSIKGDLNCNIAELREFVEELTRRNEQQGFTVAQQSRVIDILKDEILRSRQQNEQLKNKVEEVPFLEVEIKILQQRNTNLQEELSAAREENTQLYEKLSQIRSVRTKEILSFVKVATERLGCGNSVVVNTGSNGYPPNSCIVAYKSEKTSWLDDVKTKLVEKIKKVWHRTKWFFSLLGSLVLGALKGHTWSKTKVQGTKLFLSGIPLFTKPADNTTYISLAEKFETRFLNEEMRKGHTNVSVKDFEPITEEQIGTAVSYIEEALKQGKNVVLFSKAGVRRCAAVAIAYLMKLKNDDDTEKAYGEALKQITNSRPQTHIHWRTKRKINAWYSNLQKPTNTN